MTPTVFALVVWLVTVSPTMVMISPTPTAEAILRVVLSAGPNAAHSESTTQTASILDGPVLARDLPPDLVVIRLSRKPPWVPLLVPVLLLSRNITIEAVAALPRARNAARNLLPTLPLSTFLDLLPSLLEDLPLSSHPALKIVRGSES